MLSQSVTTIFTHECGQRCLQSDPSSGEFEKLWFSEVQKRENNSEMFAKVVESIERNGIGIMARVEKHFFKP